MAGSSPAHEHQQCSPSSFFLKEKSRIVSTPSDRFRRLAMGISPSTTGSQRKEKKPPASSVVNTISQSAQLEEWQTQFFKTKFCPYGVSCSNGANCRFAHSSAEVRPLPDLQRTKLCESYVKKEPCRYANCSFAHDPSELRTSSHSFYKVTLCNFYKKGKCWNGTHCRFAHGVGELQVFPPMSALLEQQQQPLMPPSLGAPLLIASPVSDVDGKIALLGTRKDSGRNSESVQTTCRNSQLFHPNSESLKVQRQKEVSNRLEQNLIGEQNKIDNTDFNLNFFNDNEKNNEYANQQCNGSFDEGVSFISTQQRWSQVNYNEFPANLLAANFGQKLKQQQTAPEMHHLGEAEVNQPMLLSAAPSSVEYNRSLSAKELNILFRQTSGYNNSGRIEQQNYKNEKIDGCEYGNISKPLVINIDQNNNINFYSTRKTSSSVLVDRELFSASHSPISNRVAKVSKNAIPIIRSQSCSSKSSLFNGNDDRESYFYNVQDRSGALKHRSSSSTFSFFINGDGDSNTNSSNSTNLFATASSNFRFPKSEIPTNPYYPDSCQFEFNSSADAYVNQSTMCPNDSSCFPTAFEIGPHPSVVSSALQPQKSSTATPLSLPSFRGVPVPSHQSGSDLIKTASARSPESYRPENFITADHLAIDFLMSFRDSPSSFTKGDGSFIEPVSDFTFPRCAQRSGSRLPSFMSLEKLLFPSQEVSNFDSLHKITDLSSEGSSELSPKTGIFCGLSNRSLPSSNNSGKSVFNNDASQIGLSKLLASLEVLNSKPEFGDLCYDEDIQQQRFLKSAGNGNGIHQQPSSLFLPTKVNEQLKSNFSSFIKDADDGISSLSNISTRAPTPATHTPRHSSDLCYMNNTVATTGACNQPNKQLSFCNRQYDSENHRCSDKVLHFEAGQGNQLLNHQSLQQTYPEVLVNYAVNSTRPNDDRPFGESPGTGARENFPSHILNSPLMNSAFGLISPSRIRQTSGAFSSPGGYSEDTTPECLSKFGMFKLREGDKCIQKVTVREETR